MIITRTPVRVSFLGGGTDFPEWYARNGGLVVGAGIDKYGYVHARHLPPYHDHKTRVVYSEIEKVKSNGEISHRAVRESLRLLGMDGEDSPGLELMYMADMPGRSGMGSSSAFVVGLLHALSALKGELMLPHQLAAAAVRVEREMMAEAGGRQDQWWAAHGGLNCIRFERNGNVNVYPLALTREQVEDFQSALMLFYTGLSRTASEVTAGYAARLATDARLQWAMMADADEGAHAVLRCDWASLGRIMDRSWARKRSLQGVTNQHIDLCYAQARLSGAAGGKLLGAGGGGCLLFVVPSPRARDAVARAMGGLGLVRVNFSFDFDGSRIIFADRGNLGEYRNVAG